MTLAFGLLAALYAFVSVSSPGYDDEFTNISLVEGNSLTTLIQVVNTSDVHPPGSYVVNSMLYHLVGNWHLVRVFSGLFSSFALGWFFATMTRSMTGAVRIFAFVCICLSPTVLLWTTGLRWYAYFLPILLLLFCELRSDRKPFRYYAVLWIGLLVLLHIGYAALIVGPPLVLFALTLRRQKWKYEYRTCIALALLAFLAATPQLLCFVRFHLPNMGTQTSSLLGAGEGEVLNYLAGQGAYPVSMPGIALVLGNCLILGLVIRRQNVLGSANSVFLLSGYALFLITKLAGKIRNLKLLSPQQGLFCSTVFDGVAVLWLRVLLMILFAFGNLSGIYNVVMHQDTTKGSWNLPYGKALESIENDARSCPMTAVLTTDPVLSYYLSKRGIRVAHARESGESAVQMNPGDCLFAVKTFRGAIGRDQYQDLYSSVNALSAREHQRHLLGRDGFAEFKRHFDSDIPDYYVTLENYVGLNESVLLPNWSY
jgi:hypothetical protein